MPVTHAKMVTGIMIIATDGTMAGTGESSVPQIIPDMREHGTSIPARMQMGTGQVMMPKRMYCLTLRFRFRKEQPASACG